MCSIGVPRIIWCAGPFVGAAHDLTIARLDGVCDVLPDSEFIGADKAYWGESQFATPFPGEDKDLDSEQRAHNYLLYAFHHTIERVIMRVKVYGIFQVNWRLSIGLHQLAVKVICKLINLFLILEPLG